MKTTSKTLIITGAYSINPDSGKITYFITIFGQENLNSPCIYIGRFELYNSNYNSVIRFATSKFCNYFKCDSYNIIHFFNVEKVQTLFTPVY